MGNRQWLDLALAGILLGTGCSSEEATPCCSNEDCPDYQVCIFGVCEPSCLPAFQGTLLRFTRLEITSSDVLIPVLVNQIWKADIRRNILNVLLRVEKFDTKAGTLDLRAGSGWHDQDPESLMAVGVEENLPQDLVPRCYRFEEPDERVFSGKLTKDHSIEIKEQLLLLIRPGKDTWATVCTGPEHLNANAIPLYVQSATGRIQSDCRGVIEGRISGCVTREDACRVCGYKDAPDYTNWSPGREVADFEVEPCTPEYCQRWCGSSWWNVGAAIDMLNPPKSDCEGNPGYYVEGIWQAEAVPEDPNPSTPKCEGST